MDRPCEPVIEERRRDSRRNTLASLQRLLDSARRSGGLEAIAISDETGCLVAGAGAWRACEELAAWAPVLAGEAANDVTPTRLDVLTRRTEVRRLSVDGIEVFLCGRATPARGAPALATAASACERILGRPRPGPAAGSRLGRS